MADNKIDPKKIFNKLTRNMTDIFQQETAAAIAEAAPAKKETGDHTQRLCGAQGELHGDC